MPRTQANEKLLGLLLVQNLVTPNLAVCDY